jgi:hypothetical protein
MTTYTVILETSPKKSGNGKRTFFIPPEFHSTEIIEADSLDDAWELARHKWYIGKATGLEIADIKAGEWHPPPPPEPEPKVEEPEDGEEEETEDENTE